MEDEPITFTPEETLEALQHLSPSAQMELSNVLMRRRLQTHMREIKQEKRAALLKATTLTLANLEAADDPDPASA